MTTEDQEKEREDQASRDPPKKPHVDDKDIDEALDETFPASDPPAY